MALQLIGDPSKATDILSALSLQYRLLKRLCLRQYQKTPKCSQLVL